MGWLALRDADNDPVQLLSRLTVLLEALDPVDAELVDALRQPSAPIDASLLPRFVDGLARRAPFQLALDDVHVVTSPASRGVLKSLTNAVPDGSQLVLISRGDLDLGLARLRAAGDLFEVGVAELALDEVETGQLFALAGIDLGPGQAAELCAAAEGWAAGLALAAMARARDEQVNPLSLGRSDIDAFFREEVLQLEPDDIREFLLATSVVERLSGPLCDAMTGWNHSGHLLAELAETNLFVIPVDDERQWFRYHHLFQDLLSVELQARGDKVVTDLLNRAAAWHEEHGDAAEAFEYARRGHDLDRAGRILLRHWDEYIGSGRIDTVLRWLYRCREDEIESDPQLAIAAGWITAHAGDPERANRYVAAAEHADLSGPSADGHTTLRAAMINLRATLGTRGATQMLEDGRSLIESELPARTRWLLGGYRCVGAAHLLLGDLDEAINALDQALVLSEANPRVRYVRMYCLGLMALVHADRGDMVRAERYAREAEELLPGLESNTQRLPVIVANAVNAANAGDGTTAAAAVAEAREMMQTARAVPLLEAELSLRCAQVAHRIGDDDTAETLASDAQLACRRVEDPGTIPTRLNALHERMVGAHTLLALLSPAEMRVLRQLATHRTLQEIADHLYVTRPTVKTHVAAIYSKLGVSTRAEAVAALGDDPHAQLLIDVRHPNGDASESFGRALERGQDEIDSRSP